MTSFRITKAPFRQFLLGLVGIVFVLAAMDILWLHKLSSEPDKNDAGEITTRGEAWRRTDLIWGSLFMLTGGGLFVVAAIGLAAGTSVAEITDEGLRLRVGGPQRMVTFPWDSVTEVRAGLAEGDGVRPRPVLLVAVRDPMQYPYDLWRAEWVGDVLQVDTDGWSVPPEELAVRMEIELSQWERHAAEEAQPGDRSEE